MDARLRGNDLAVFGFRVVPGMTIRKSPRPLLQKGERRMNYKKVCENESRIKSGMTRERGNDGKGLISFRPIGGSRLRDAKTFLMFFPLQFDMNCGPEESRNTPQHA